MIWKNDDGHDLYTYIYILEKKRKERTERKKELKELKGMREGMRGDF